MSRDQFVRARPLAALTTICLVGDSRPKEALWSRGPLSQRLLEGDPRQRSQRGGVDDVVRALAEANGVGMMTKLQMHHAEERLAQQLR